MKIIELNTAEAETIERAIYEADSYERIMAILGRQLNADANAETSKILAHYAELCRGAQMKLKMAQDTVLSHYIGREDAGKMCRFDIVRGEVQIFDGQTT